MPESLRSNGRPNIAYRPFDTHEAHLPIILSHTRSDNSRLTETFRAIGMSDFASRRDANGG